MSFNKVGWVSFLCILVSTAATAPVNEAHAFPVYASVNGYVTPAGAEATACNVSYGVPIRCAVQVRGYYPNGVYKYAVADLVLPPGGCDYAFVTSGFYPFSYADAYAECAFFP